MLSPTPLPLSIIVVVEAPVAETKNCPVNSPTEFGVKVTVTKQVSPASRTLGQVFVCLNVSLGSSGFVMVRADSDLEPIFFTVITECEEPLGGAPVVGPVASMTSSGVSQITSEKLIVFGDMNNAVESPVPVKLIIFGSPSTGLIVRVPVKAPEVDGVKLIIK